MHKYFLLRKVILKFHDFIIFIGAAGKFSNGWIWSEWLMLRLNADRLTIASMKFKMSSVYIFTGTICKPGVTKLVTEQSGPFPHVASQSTQIFHSIN